MNNALIDRLAMELKPTPRWAVVGRLLTGLVFGAVISFIAVVEILGLRPDLTQAAMGSMFWVKLLYTGSLGSISVWSLERLSRPVKWADRRLSFLIFPFIAITMIAASRLATAPSSDLPSLVMGASAKVCPWLILATAAPVYLGLVWAIRGLAPTRLKTAGLAAGVGAGGFGALVYSLHCPEAASPFIALWYTLGIAIAGLAGSLLGPLAFRWTDPKIAKIPPL